MSFSEWKEVKLGSVVKVIDSLHVTPKYVEVGYPIIRVQDIYEGLFDIQSPLYVTKEVYEKYTKKHKPKKGDILFTRVGANNGISSYVNTNSEFCIGQNTCILTEYSEGVYSKYIYYLMISNIIKQQIQSMNTGSTHKTISLGNINNFQFYLPSYDEQKSIADILYSIDEKIELNTHINKTLEEIAKAIFKSWFVDFEPFEDGAFEDSELGMIPKGWKVGSLDTIANYLNGLAMQKFRPEGEEYLPVIKIKELNQGVTDENSDKASVDIKEDYIIQDGDVIFSWSGTLLVKIWTGGIGALNQHLFKVTSDKFPKWYYYLWTCHHLRQFQAIAKDKATTMGHIKRSHLSESKVLIPNDKDFNTLNEIIDPIINQIIEVNCQNMKFTQIRDSLLPKLMSGEIRVPTEEV